ncbi:Zinc finger protein Elbow [Dirofilaria immitis]|nr:Zinc finger protein Elbow [Dirofilaria immitis]
MVSTHSQYLTDYNSTVMPSKEKWRAAEIRVHESLEDLCIEKLPIYEEQCRTDSGKSPLAMLAKTCETIGLPDTSNRKSNKDGDKSRDRISPSSSTSAHSPSVGKKTPIGSEPSTSAAASLPANLMLSARSCFPMNFSPLATSFPAFPYPSLMPGFPTVPTFAAAGGFQVEHLILFYGCPATLMTRPCVTPGCTSCTMHNAAAAAAASTTPADLMMTFPPSFFAATYSPLLSGTLPPTSSSAAQIAYQNLMAAASGQASKHICNWIETSNGVCGKSFPTADELASHMKAAHAPSTTNSSNSNDLKASSSPRSTTAASLINHAAAAASFVIIPVPNPLGIPPFPTMTNFPSAAALQAMYTQRLMATMPHP